jgi:hypothetical protein
MAQAGYVVDNLYIYDPWYRNKFFTKLTTVSAGLQGMNFYSLPNGQLSASVLTARYMPEVYYPIMEINGSVGKRNYLWGGGKERTPP